MERNSRPLFAWWLAPDHVCTKVQFIASYGVPVLIPSAVLLVYAVRTPSAASVLVLSFYLGSLWFTLLVLRKPAGTLVQPLERGLRFHVPALQASSVWARHEFSGGELLERVMVARQQGRG